MNVKLSTLLKLVICGSFAFLTAELQAQLIYKTKFSAVEGYTNGWVIGQPSIGTKWANANAFFDQDIGNCNNGHSWWPTEADIPGWSGGPWYICTATNTTAPGGGYMKIASDNNFGTNKNTYFFKMDFPTGNQLRGPITVTWDWQYFMTNAIPADYNVYTNPHPELPGYDTGFTFSDYANRMVDGNPNWVYNELSTPFRLGTYQDARHNPVLACGGGGDWNNYGPQFKDGKVLHMKLIAYVTNSPVSTNSCCLGNPTINTYDGFCQRDGETNWQTAFYEGGEVSWITRDPYCSYPPDCMMTNDMVIAQSGMRRCAGEVDPTSGINCLMLWMNSTQYPRYVTVSNIRVVGPDPVPRPTLSILGSTVTFTGWLEAADSLKGPWTTVAIQTPYTIPPGTGMKFFRADN